MLLASELKEAKANGTLGTKILLFAQDYRTLLVPSPEVLAETVLILHSLVLLSDKVLPLKSFFNMVQQIQRTRFLALANETNLEKEFPDAPPEEIRLRLDQDAQRRLCTEDAFMVACAFIEVEIAKQGSVHYLKGESPDFAETKKNRNPLDLRSGVVLKTISSSLARPDEKRGAVERGQIESGFNHLAKLNKLFMIMGEAVKWIKDGDLKNIPRKKIDVRKEFKLSHTDYETIMSMARREGLITFRNRNKDPSNNYVLRAENHERVMEYAAGFGHSPQKALNKILDNFFELLKINEMKRQRDKETSKGE